ncbi:MAG TPA: efflux RND transporter periplasmic adaptor subunit [Thiobacillaceae bacterium]|nr:efflux RND transporter periplasmic adaptor subunit [Thiobacillaceae bacterium]
MKRFLLPLLLLLLAVGAVAIFQHEKRHPAPAAPALLPSYVAAEGKVEAMPGYDINLGTGELNAKVARILVQEGDTVSPGQLVVVLDNADLRAQAQAAERQLAVAQSRLSEVLAGARREEIMQAAAALDGATAGKQEAERLYQRYKDLRAQGMVSPAALDERDRALKEAGARMEEARQQYKLLLAGPRPETVKLSRNQVTLARAELEHSRKLLDKTVLRSPIAGTVIKRYLDEGEGVTPEIPILAIADLRRVWINAEVDETDVGRIAVGDPVAISSDAYPGAVFKGQVRQIADYAGERRVKPNDPAVNLGLKVVQVKIGLEQPAKLKLGMTVNVKISPPRERASVSR